ncbi:MAG: hypothetical protein KBC17_02375 [Candidatus Pacebacteria bacterium]|nr:hypothetical protein [Candidatus Paceibacterota bacterium]
MTDNLKYLLPAEAMDLNKGPRAGVMKEILCGRIIDLRTFKVKLPGEENAGKNFLAYIKLASSQYDEGSTVYYGNIVIPPANGCKGETRAFLWDAYNQKGLIAKRGVAYQLIGMPDGTAVEEGLFTIADFKKIAM